MLSYNYRPLTTTEADEILILLELAGHNFGKTTKNNLIIEHYSWNGKFYEVTTKLNSKVQTKIIEITTKDN